MTFNNSDVMCLSSITNSLYENCWWHFQALGIIQVYISPAIVSKHLVDEFEILLFSVFIKNTNTALSMPRNNNLWKFIQKDSWESAKTTQVHKSYNVTKAFSTLNWHVVT